MTEQQKNLRMHIRNFCLTMTFGELQVELKISEQRNDKFRAQVIQEMINAY